MNLDRLSAGNVIVSIYGGRWIVIRVADTRVLVGQRTESGKQWVRTEWFDADEVVELATPTPADFS